MASGENLAPAVMSRLLKEIRALSRSPPDGVTYVPQDDNLTEIIAEISGPEGTPYEGGSFRVKLILGSEYPSAPPKGFFLTRIFHPNVSESGDICVNALKRDWQPTLTLAHILKVVWCLLIVPFPESSLNDEAGKLFMESYDEYAERARLMTQIHALPAVSAPKGAAACSGSGQAAQTAAPSATAAAKAGSTASAAPAGGAKRAKKAKKKTLKRL